MLVELSFSFGRTDSNETIYFQCYDCLDPYDIFRDEKIIDNYLKKIYKNYYISSHRNRVIFIFN